MVDEWKKRVNMVAILFIEIELAVAPFNQIGCIQKEKAAVAGSKQDCIRLGLSKIYYQIGLRPHQNKNEICTND